MAPFVLLDAPKEQFAPVHGSFCPFDSFKRTFCFSSRLLLSFWQLQKDIPSPDTACFVLLTASKRHFGPRCNAFCPFDCFKRTFRDRMQRVLSFWQLQKDIPSPDTACFVLLTASKRHFGPRYSLFCPFDFQKDIPSPDATCFVLLAASKRHSEPGCRVFCPFDSLKKTFQA